MGNTFYFQWEVDLMVAIQSHLSPILVSIAKFITNFGDQIILVGLIGFIYWCYDKKFGEHLGTNMVMAICIFPQIKNILVRRRPYFDHEGIECLAIVDKEAPVDDIIAQGFSCPSGHSINSLTAYGTVAKYTGKKGLKIGAAILIALIGLSRVCLGVHYPTDVLFGWVLGFVIIYGMDFLRSKIKNENVIKLIIAVLCLPGLFFCDSTDYFTSLGLLFAFFIAFPFEKKFVNFKTTKKPLNCVIRVLGGLLIFLAANAILKLPFSEEFLAAGDLTSHLVRTVRYCIVGFCAMGLWPMCFKFIDKIFDKK